MAIHAKSDSQEQHIYQYFQSKDITPSLISKSRILLHETDIGKIAFARQLKPVIYIDSDSSTCQNLKQHIGNIVQYKSLNDAMQKLNEKVQ